MYKELRNFKEVLVECDIYKRKNELGKEFFLSFSYGDQDDDYSLDFIALECKSNLFEATLITGGQKIASCVIDDRFTEDKCESYIDELNNCKEKTYFIVDNTNDIIYRIIVK